VNGEALDVLLEELVSRVASRVAAELTLQLVDLSVTQLPRSGDDWRLWDVDETARRLGRSPRWVRDHKNEIVYVKLDKGALAFRPEDVQRFAADRRVPLLDDDRSRLRPVDSDRVTPLTARARGGRVGHASRRST
jgi:hypothetical protein